MVDVTGVDADPDVSTFTGSCGFNNEVYIKPPSVETFDQLM